MPVKTGDAATRELRAMGITTPIVGISASKLTPEFRQQCLRSSGFTEMVTKPLSVDALRTLCSRFMRSINVPLLIVGNNRRTTSLSRALDSPGGRGAPDAVADLPVRCHRHQQACRCCSLWW